MQLTVNQRFTHFLDLKKINQKTFCDITGMLPATVSYIVSGRTDKPKSDFFAALLEHYPELNLRWLLLGEGHMLLSDTEMQQTMIAREPETPPYDVQQLLVTVHKLSESLASMAKLVNDVPALREEVERLKKEITELKKK